MSGAWAIGCGRHNHPRQLAAGGAIDQYFDISPDHLLRLGEGDLLLGEHQLFHARLFHGIGQLAGPFGPSACRIPG
jgi:hypothetical protein